MERLLKNQHITPEGKIVGEIRLPSESRWFDGHFPDNPILPGVAQLHLVSVLVSRILASNQTDLSDQSGQRIGLFRKVRFKKMLRPNDFLQISVNTTGTPETRQFKINKGDQLACSGMLTLKQCNSTSSSTPLWTENS